jgi:hypothetical protein
MSQASWFMKPTISTSPLTWSWTTAGISPSSFEKSISHSYNKKPRHHFRRGCIRFGWFRVLAFSPSARAVLPGGHVAVVVMRAVEAGKHGASRLSKRAVPAQDAAVVW